MLISLIKKSNEKIPYWIKKPFSKIIRNGLIKNRQFLDTYFFLCEYDLMSDNEKEKLQLKYLKKTLEHAYKHTKYYHNLFNSVGFGVNSIENLSDLEKIPILTKDILKNNLEDILADDISDFYQVTTGGTNGEPIKVQMEKNAIYREWAFVYHYWSKFGYDYKTTKLATLRGVDLGNKLYEINPLYSEIRLNPFALNENNMDKYIGAIDRFGADMIYGYPSAVYNFCRILDKKGIEVKDKFKAAFLISENLYGFQEDMIKKVLNCNIAIFYGHSERAVFAEKYNQGYLFNSLYGAIEFNENHEPIVTGFINRKTPLIRYLLDDEATPIGKEFEISGHHSSEVLVGYNNEQVSMAAINLHDDTFKDVKEYQFLQEEVGKCILRIVAEKEMGPQQLEKIKRRIEKKLGRGFICTPVLVDAIELSRRGKYKMLISKLHI